MKKRAKLHLVGQDPVDVFDDMDRLRDDLGAPQRRTRVAETFARIPHDKGLALDITGNAWRVLIELDRLILKARGQNPLPFSSKRLRAIGLSSNARAYALRRLEAVGVIVIRRRGRGHSPWIFHTWYPKRS